MRKNNKAQKTVHSVWHIRYIRISDVFPASTGSCHCRSAMKPGLPSLWRRYIFLMGNMLTDSIFQFDKDTLVWCRSAPDNNWENHRMGIVTFLAYCGLLQCVSLAYGTKIMYGNHIQTSPVSLLVLFWFTPLFHAVFLFSLLETMPLLLMGFSGLKAWRKLASSLT